jgi:hypothetical protein
MKERRHSERIKCRFSCELVRAGKAIAGTVVDISSGGLAVRAEEDLSQGDPVEVRMNVPGHSTLTVEALIWHVRRARLRETGETVHLLGLMVSRAPDEFFVLARGRRRATTRRSGARAEASTAGADSRTPHVPPSRGAELAPAADAARPSPAKPADPVVTELAPYRIRLKHRASPRTRVLTVDASSRAEAREIAVTELGVDWEILEARAGARR